MSGYRLKTKSCFSYRIDVKFEFSRLEVRVNLDKKGTFTE